jgi:8-oxo-dGTP diphosphatase
MFTKYAKLEIAQAHALTNNLRQRVCVYITRGLELLVFTHEAKYPTAGTQVPAGGLEAGETIFEAATREATEETGLENLEIRQHLGSGVYENGMNTSVWHFVWLELGQGEASPALTINTWEHLAEENVVEKYVFECRFEPLENAVLHYDMDAMLPELWTAMGFNVIEKAVCYVTRVQGQGDHYKNSLELLVLEGHKDGGLHVPRGTLELNETSSETAKRELLEESGLQLESAVSLGRSAFRLTRATNPAKQKQVWYYHHYQFNAPNNTPSTWTHTVSAGKSDTRREYQYKFVPLENTDLAQGMNVGLNAIQGSNSRMALRPVAICYITRGKEILTFTGHPDGGIGVPAGGIEDGETPAEAAIREILEESGLTLENPIFLGRQDYYFKGSHPENGSALEFYEDRYYYWFVTSEPRDSWDWVVSDGIGDKGKVFKHSFVPITEAQIDWDMDEFITQINQS